MRARAGTVTLAALLAAARNAGSSIKDMRFICAGAGSAGLGVCAQVRRPKRESAQAGVGPKRERPKWESAQAGIGLSGSRPKWEWA